MLRLASVVVFCALCPVALAQAPGEPVALAPPSVETSKVNLNGKRHDNTRTDCLTSPQVPYRQNAFVATVATSENADVATCTLSFSSDVEYVPGIFEPTKVCLTTHVVSKGGAPRVGKRGRVSCTMAGQYVSVVASENPENAGGDSAPTIPTLPADLSLERAKRSLVTASVPLSLLQHQIDSGIAGGLPDLPAGFKLQVLGSRFENVAAANRMLAYFIDVDLHGPIGARCSVTARFSIPAAPLDALRVQDVGTSADCRTGSLIGQLANLGTLLSNAIRAEITKTLANKLFEGNDTLNQWKKEDPDLAAFLGGALVQGSYCDWRGKPGLCLSVGWPKRNAIAIYEAGLLGKAPVATGPFDRSAAVAKLALFRKAALSDRMAVTKTGVRYPAGNFANGALEDGDMALFGGLLCKSGEEEGCKLLRNASTEGRFWRSPGRVGEAESASHATFSGDQMKGVLHFLIATGDKARLAALLDYLRSMPANVPSDAQPLETGYSSCPNFAPNFTCLIGGADWHVLRLLAVKHGLSDRLPKDLAALESRYGFNYDTLVWEGLLTNSGYRLHLVANTAWLLRSLGVNDVRIDKAITLLAARQPNNPFFRYLKLGSDKKGQELTDAQCLAPEGRKDSSDWAWQRADRDEAWRRSMVWDCVFMYGLMTNPSRL